MVNDDIEWLIPIFSRALLHCDIKKDKKMLNPCKYTYNTGFSTLQNYQIIKKSKWTWMIKSNFHEKYKLSMEHIIMSWCGSGVYVLSEITMHLHIIFDR